MYIHTEKIVEPGVQQFWTLSLAWRGVPGYAEKVTVGGLLKALSPLKDQTASKTLALQATDLTNQVVKGSTRRKKRKSSITLLPLPLQQIPLQVKRKVA